MVDGINGNIASKSLEENTLGKTPPANIFLLFLWAVLKVTITLRPRVMDSFPYRVYIQFQAEAIICGLWSLPALRFYNPIQSMLSIFVWKCHPSCSKRTMKLSAVIKQSIFCTLSLSWRTSLILCSYDLHLIQKEGARRGILFDDTERGREKRRNSVSNVVFLRGERRGMKDAFWAPVQSTFKF